MIPQNSTPESKTGVNQEQPKLIALIDYLAGSFPSRRFSEIEQLVSAAFGGCDFEQRKFGIKWYEKSWLHPCGAMLGAGHRGGVERDFLEMKGSTLALLDDVQQHKLMNQLLLLGFTASRIDLTLDDFAKTFSAADAKEAYDNAGVRGFRERINPAGVWHESGKNGAFGATMTFGKRGSNGGGKVIRIYDKNLESKGERDCSRIELSLYNVSAVDCANQAFQALCNCDCESWFFIVQGYINNSIDFINRDGDDTKRFVDCERYSWWEAIMNAAPFLAFCRKQKENSIQKVKSWIKSQIAPSLSMLIDSFANDSSWWDWFWEVIFDGENRRKERHEYMLKEFKLAHQM